MDFTNAFKSDTKAGKSFKKKKTIVTKKKAAPKEPKPPKSPKTPKWVKAVNELNNTTIDQPAGQHRERGIDDLNRDLEDMNLDPEENGQEALSPEEIEKLIPRNLQITQ